MPFYLRPKRLKRNFLRSIHQGNETSDIFQSVEEDDAQNLARIRHPDIAAYIGVINVLGKFTLVMIIARPEDKKSMLNNYN